MNRRNFIKATGIAAGSALLGPEILGRNSTLNSLSSNVKPNILLIMTDQQSADVLSFRMGKDYLNTPNMDELASRGTFFTNAFTANPLCVPARTSLFTGLYPHQTKVQTNSDITKPLAGQYLHMGTIFKNAGYDTGYVGKWHMAFPPENKDAHGFEYMESIKNNGIDNEVPEAVAKFLKQKRENPFLLVASFVNPHNICEWPRGDKLPDGEVGDPPPLELCPPQKENYLPMQEEPEIITFMKKSVQSNRMFPVGNFDEKKWREYRWAYFRMVEKVDELIGKVVKSLKDSGQYNNTVIVFTSDHGDMQGAHGWNQKTVFYEESAGVPFIISKPGNNKSATSDRLVNICVDILPTICDYAGIPIPQNLPGFSLKSTVDGVDFRDPRDFVVSQNKMVQGVPIDGIKPEPSGRMIRSKRYKYCVYDTGMNNESLVDLENDPGEMVNLAYKKEYSEVLKQHRKYFKEFSEKYGDDFIYKTDKIE